MLVDITIFQVRELYLESINLHAQTDLRKLTAAHLSITFFNVRLLGTMEEQQPTLVSF